MIVLKDLKILIFENVPVLLNLQIFFFAFAVSNKSGLK